MSEARQMLDLAARLALRAVGDVEPNPAVGCVIANRGRVIGVGHHRKFGGPHAEVEALADCARRGEDARGSTVYVTLEPCNSQGKQPPCSEALIKAGVGRVIYATTDPNPGKALGAARLTQAGIAVERCKESTLANRLSKPFLKRVVVGLPWIIAKWAQSIDGRVATRSGDSKWISSDRSRRRVHRLRARVDAIVTGIGTVRADDPLLTARDVRRTRRKARRIVIDSDLSIDPACRLVKTARDVPTLVACVRGRAGARVRDLERAGVIVLECAERDGRVDLQVLLRNLLITHGVSTVLVEAGPTLVGELFRQDLVDEAVVHLAPMVMGDSQARGLAEGSEPLAVADVRRYSLWRVKQIGDDVELVYGRSTLLA